MQITGLTAYRPDPLWAGTSTRASVRRRSVRGSRRRCRCASCRTRPTRARTGSCRSAIRWWKIAGWIVAAIAAIVAIVAAALGRAACRSRSAERSRRPTRASTAAHRRCPVSSPSLVWPPPSPAWRRSSAWPMTPTRLPWAGRRAATRRRGDHLGERRRRVRLPHRPERRRGLPGRGRVDVTPRALRRHHGDPHGQRGQDQHAHVRRRHGDGTRQGRVPRRAPVHRRASS